MNNEYRLEIFPILTIIFFPDRKSGLMVKDEIKNHRSAFDILFFSLRTLACVAGAS